MNKMKEVAKALGYEVGEEFNLIFTDGKYSRYNPFKFTETDLVDKNGDVLTNYIGRIITGEYKIEKIPKFPPKGTRYYFVNESGFILKCEFDWEYSFDLYRYKLGNFFLTKEEAEQNKDKVLDFFKNPTKGEI